MKWRLIPYAMGNPVWNMAVDEALFQCYQNYFSPPTLRFYGWNPPTVSLGYFQEWDAEINPAMIRELGYALIRRCTGGRTVLHHRELTYAVVGGTAEGFPQGLLESYLTISRALVGGLRKIGVEAELHQGFVVRSKSGACFDAPSYYELTVEGRKLVGSAQLRQRECLLQHGSIMLDFSASDLSSVLRLSPEQKESFETEIRQRATSLRDLGLQCHPAELAKAITLSFMELYGIEFENSGLTMSELEWIERLTAQKYGNAVWNRTRGHLSRSSGG
jgi:lipoate-protein ligase A